MQAYAHISLTLYCDIKILVAEHTVLRIIYEVEYDLLFNVSNIETVKNLI